MTPTSAWRGPDPADIVAWSLVQVGHLVGRRFWASLGAEGLTPVQFGAMLQLDRSPGLSNAALARSVLVTPQSMSALLVELVEQGLVVRDAPAGRGRAISARLTVAGRRRLRRCERAVAEVEQSLRLDPDEAAALTVSLHRILSQR